MTKFCYFCQNVVWNWTVSSNNKYYVKEDKKQKNGTEISPQIYLLPKNVGFWSISGQNKKAWDKAIQPMNSCVEHVKGKLQEKG